MSVASHRNRVYLWLLLVFMIPATVAAVDVSGMYTATVPGDPGKVTSLALTLTEQGTINLPCAP